MDPSKKTGMALMLFGIVILSLSALGSIMPKITIVVDNSKPASNLTLFSEINQYYLCEGCYLTYARGLNDILIETEIQRIGAFAYYYGYFKFFFVNEEESFGGWRYRIKEPEILERDNITVFLLEFPQPENQKNYITVTGEIWLLDHITIDLT